MNSIDLASLAALLRRETLAAHEDNELPDFLVRELLDVAATIDRYAGQEDAIVHLISQVRDYDTYGQTGYLGMGVNHVILSTGVRRLKLLVSSG